jgi:hypothetical protein
MRISDCIDPFGGGKPISDYADPFPPDRGTPISDYVDPLEQFWFLYGFQ